MGAEETILTAYGFLTNTNPVNLVRLSVGLEYKNILRSIKNL